MPRPLRPALVNGTHHITAHGVGEEDIFRDDADRAMYLSLLQNHAVGGGVRILAYVLMSNHVHLVLSTTETNLSALIQREHGIYGARFNRKYARTGHLFGSRFYSDPVETDEHLLASTRYIHRNPVRANMVERPEQHPWSSYRAYLGSEPDELIDTGPVLALFSPNRTRAVSAYVSFVMQTPSLSELLKAVDDGHCRVHDLVQGVAELLNLTPSAADHRTRGSPARHLSVMLLTRRLGWDAQRIAAEMGVGSAGVLRILGAGARWGNTHDRLPGLEELLKSLG